MYQCGQGATMWYINLTKWTSDFVLYVQHNSRRTNQLRSSSPWNIELYHLKVVLQVKVHYLTVT